MSNTRAHLTPDEIVQIKLAVAAGETYTAVAKRFGCSKSGVQHHARAFRRAQQDAMPIADEPRYRVKVSKCPGCPMLFLNRRNQTRTYCTNECRLAAHRREQQLKLDEFKWIAGTDSWDNIAARLGFASRSSMATWLERLGEKEWMSRVNDSGIQRTYLRAA
jgi:transposase